MFKNIQNYLLLHCPLLWNIRIIPVLAAMVSIHIIFFGIGYASGIINFTETDTLYNYGSENAPLMIFFSILISILVFITWIMFYFRNNAYKSFYPQSNASLYTEWLLIALVCILNCSYMASYSFAYDLKARNYFSEEEFSHRVDIISMASVFVIGSYEQNPEIMTEENGERIKKTRSFLTYNNKQYAFTSLINKSLKKFTYQDRKKDSLNEARVKGWLIHNRKDSVLWLMTEFDKIVKSHDLKSNIAPQQWLILSYNYPDFKQYTVVGNIEKYSLDSVYDYGESDFSQSDNYVSDGVKLHQNDTLTTTQYINGQNYVFPKYYVPLKQLNNAYDKISGTWISRDPSPEMLLFYIYFGLGLSLAIFSFRVTSGKSWLIAIVAIGIAGMITGAFSLVSGTGEAFPSLWLCIIGGIAIYFISKSMTGQYKGISDIVLNALLWLAPWFMFLLYLTTVYITRIDYYSNINIDHPFYDWITKHEILLMYANIAFVFLYMYFLTIAIKRWKGIAEG